MTSPDSFVITRLSDGMFVSVNKGFTEITGYAAEEVIGKTSLEINIWKNPEDRIKIVERLKAKGEVRNYEACFLAKNREFYGLVSASIIELNGEPHILNVTRDITDRKEAEDALTHSHDLMRYIIEHNRSAVAVHDRDLRYIYVSKRYLDDYKVDIRDVIGKHHYDVFPYLPQKWRDVHQKALSGEISSAEDDPYVREDGTVDWTRWECRPWYEANGSIGGIIIYTEVITERKRAEQAKAKLEGQLQRAQKMESIGSLAGGIAHDLNNILFPISGLSEMLLDDMPPDNPAFENIEQIYKSAQRGSDLVKQILSFSRQGNPQKLPIRIQPILKEALKLAQATIPRNIEVKSHINMDCGMVSADPTQIHQIVMNLITNAFHAVEQTGGTIDIALKETAIESFAEKEDLPFHAIPGDLLTGRYACITVSDTGTGIDQTQIDKIFDPFRGSWYHQGTRRGYPGL
jgi:PAS domain S-box-containing protein